MNDLIIVQLTENQKGIAAANSYSGESGAWLNAVSADELSMASENKTVVLMLDGRLAVMQQMTVPDLEDAKLLKILPGLMDEKIATSGQHNQFAFVGGYNSSAQSRGVCVIEKETLTEILRQASLLGIIPDVVVPDFALLEAPEAGARVVALDGRYVVRIENGNGFAAEKNIAEAIIGGLAKAEIIKPSDWYKDLAHGVDLSCNFLHGEYARKANWVSGLIWWKRSLYLAFAAVITYYSLYYYNAVQNYQSAEKLYTESENLFRDALPNEPRIVNIEAQLRRAVSAQLQTDGGEFFGLFAIAAQAVRADPTAAIETVRYDESDSELLLTISFPSYAETAKFNEILSSAGLQVSEGSSRQEGGRVYADLQVRRR